jgi:hypothetical protein
LEIFGDIKHNLKIIIWTTLVANFFFAFFTAVNHNPVIPFLENCCWLHLSPTLAQSISWDFLVHMQTPETMVAMIASGLLGK